MAGFFFDSLLDVLNNIVTNFHNQLESAAEQSVIDRCDLQELSSTAKLAEVDMLLLADTEQRNGQLSTEAREHAAASANTLQDYLDAQASFLAGGDCPDPSRNELAFDTVQFRRAATDLAQLTDSVQLQAPRTIVADITEPLRNTGEVPDTKVKNCLDVLYSALTTQLSSNCGHKHVARLKLTGFTNDVDSQKRFFFDLFLSSHFDWIPCRWIQICCKIEKSVETVDPPLCQLVQDSEVLKQTLSLRLGEVPVGSLVRDRGILLSNQSSPTVSLEYLIVNGYFDKTYRSGIIDPQNRYFLPSERAALCCTLARSLLHLSHGPWTRVNWKIDGVFFLEDASTGRLLDKSKPYLTWTFDRSPPNENDSSQDRPAVEGEAPNNQILVNFARLMIEVYGHQRLQVDQPAVDLHEFLYGCIDEISDQNVCLAVMACLGSEGKEAVQDDSSPHRLQIFIHQQVLKHLEASKASYRKPQIEEPGIMTQPADHARLNRWSTLSDKSPYDGKEYDSPQNVSAAKGALDFVYEMKKFTERYIERPIQRASTKLPSYLDNKIKIAIIDSGARKTDSLVLGAKNGGKLEGRNFQPGSPEQWDDTHGHGTHTTRLLLDMAPQANIYVAKVTNGQRIEQDMISCITEAVKWAVQVWDVDIISLSLIMPEKNEKLEEALGQAMDPGYDGGRRRIVFAAAGNTGGIRPMGWLATMPNIIAIHATDGLGAPANFNPTSLSGVSFATLGQDIQSNWKETDKHNSPKPIYLSGTSFATPIAAAIAANVLEWARWNIKLTEDRKKLLYSPGKMRLVFAKMMQARSGVHYVQPWTLWDHGWDDGSGVKKAVVEVLREVIAS